MRILFHMLPEPGHLNPTFPIARALAARGHEIVYTSLLDLQPVIEARGFRCVALHRDVVRRGRLAELEQMATAAEREGAWIEIRDRLEDEYFDGRVEAAIRAIDPAVIAADVVTLSPIQYVAHALGIACVQLSTSLSQRHGELPPLTSALAPGARPLELAAARWEASALRHVAFERVPVAPVITGNAEHYAARFGYPPERLAFDAVFSGAFTAWPELVLAPAALEFPRGAGGPVHFATPVELDRPEHVPPALEDFARGAATLIYASLGSQAGRYPEARRFFGAVVAALRANPGWRAIVGAGPRFAGDPVLADAPPNVQVMASVPQLWVLRRAAAFVTHAGLGSVREAVALGVPIVAVPQQYDQHGNAARVAYHGIGVRLPPEAVTGTALARELARVLDDGAGYRARLAALDAACRAEEARSDAIALVESAAIAEAPPPPPHVPTPAAGPPLSSPPAPADAAPGPSAGADAAAAPSPRADTAGGWMFVGHAGLLALRPGTRLRDPRAPLELGGAGFAIARDLVPALLRGTGPILVRVTVAGDLVDEPPCVIGRELRVHWRLDLTEALHDHARWCAAQARAIDEPGAALATRIADHHARRDDGAGPDALFASFCDAFACAAPRWHHGERATAAAVAPGPDGAARWAHRLAIKDLARRAAGRAGTAAAYTAHHAAIAERFAAALARRVAQRIADAMNAKVAGVAGHTGDPPLPLPPPPAAPPPPAPAATNPRPPAVGARA